jgi:pimeloyl-ACP methyl ester carboxylesterase
VETGQLEVRGFKISYEVFGNPQAPPILLLPSWQIIHSRHWKMQVPYLARFFRVVTYDSPGNGGGERTTDPAAYEMDRMVDYGVGLLDHLSIAQADVIGFSRGCSYGLWLAAGYPERVRRLIMIGFGPPNFDENPAFWQRRNHYEGWQKRNAHYWREDYRGWLAFFFAQIFTEPHSTKPIEDGINWGLATTPEILISTIYNPALSPKMPAEEAIRRVGCPVLLIHGTEDNLNDIAHSRRLAESRPDWEFVALEGCGHAPHLRDPVKVNLLMMDFLRRSHK